MAIDISVSGPNGGFFGVVLYVSGLTYGNFYTVLRTVTSGHYPPTVVKYVGTPLSLYRESSPSLGGFADQECPFGEVVTYTLYEFSPSDLVTAIASDSVNYDPTLIPAEGFTNTGASMISDPNTFAYWNNEDNYYSPHVTGTVVEFGALSRSANILGNHKILGRNNPVIISDVMGGRRGSMTIANISSIAQTVGSEARTANYDIIPTEETIGWPVIFEDGRTLLFRSYWKQTGIDDFYFKPISISSERVSRVVGSHSGAQMQLLYTIEFEEIDGAVATDPADVAPTWAQVATHNSTWQEVDDDHTDWADVLANPTA